MHFSVHTKTAARIRVSGYYLRGKMISLRFLPGEAFLYSAVVSKKQGTAAQRNRIKRIIREIMRAGEQTYPPGSYLVYYNGTSAQLDRNEISANIHTLMETIQHRNAL